MTFGRAIITWYQKNKRDLPWRQTRDPYRIWLSEIILQQTRVEQGLNYYLRFVEKYPDVMALAEAKQDEVLKLWQGLGYYSRARNLHSAAQEIAETFKGDFPKAYHELLQLKGIGEYTAAAISSFSFAEKQPVVDGNVFRLLSRYLGIRTPIDSGKAKKQFREIAFELMGTHPPHDFNQAIMEFGSRQCKPVNPDCNNCPLQSTCFAFEHKQISSFPVKQKKTTVKKRYFHYLVIKAGRSFYLQKRTGKDIWIHLYDFPVFEFTKKTSTQQFLNSGEWKRWVKKYPVLIEKISPEKKHLLSHQTIFARFLELRPKHPKTFKPFKDWKKVSPSTLKKYAVPRLADRYLKEQKLV